MEISEKLSIFNKVVYCVLGGYLLLEFEFFQYLPILFFQYIVYFVNSLDFYNVHK